MNVNKTGIGAVGLSILLLGGCGGGESTSTSANPNTDNTNPSNEEQLGSFSSISGVHMAVDLSGQNSAFLMAVSPNGALYLSYNSTSQSGQAVGIGQMTDSPIDFESTFDVYDLDTGLYFDTVTLKGELNSETELTITESSPKVSFESNGMSGTFPSMKSFVAVESPASAIPNKAWTLMEGSTSLVTSVQRDGTRLSFVDNLGCVYTGDLTPSQGSPHFLSGDHLAFTPHAYDYRGTIQNCAQESFVGFVDLLSFTIPDVTGTQYVMQISVQSTGGVILATLE